MKKLVLIVCTLAICTASLQAQNKSKSANSKLDQKVEQIIQRATVATMLTNKGAIKENKRVDFRIEESLRDINTGEEEGPYEADIACKAYALDSHWLLLAGTCMRYSNEDIHEYDDHKHIERFGRKITYSSVAPLHHAQNSNIMLIWRNEAFYNAPFVNVLATSNPSKLFALSANHTVQINTARFGADGVKSRSLKTNSVQGNTFKLNESWRDLSGTATDPLFLISPNGNEFLAAYNDGYISYALQMTFDDIFHTYDGLKSDTWFTLTQADLEFIKQTVQANRPGDWATIKNRLFLDNTQTPYFKN